MDGAQRHTYLIWIALLIGVGNEVTAAATGVWTYTPWYMTFVNCVLMFGMIMAWVAARWYEDSLAVVYGVGAGIGLAYEFVDEAFLHWAHLANDRFLFFPGLVSSRIAIGFLWGVVPVLCVLALRAIERRGAASA